MKLVRSWTRLRTSMLFVMLSAGCAPTREDRTQVLVSVEGDPTLLGQLRGVRAFLYAEAELDESNVAASWSFTASATDLSAVGVAPFSFGITRGKSERFKLVIKGYTSSEPNAAPVVERKLLVTFRARESLPVVVYLARVCRDRALPCGGLMSTCAPFDTANVAAGQCGPVATTDDAVEARPSAEAGLDSQVSDSQVPDSQVAPPDAEVDAGADGSGSSADAGRDTGSAPPLEGVCAMANVCTAPAYPCVVSETAGYTCQGQLADWPMPDSVPGSKRAPSYDLDSLDYTRDEVTELTWQKELPSPYPGCTGRQSTAGDSCSWEEAKAYCSNLRLVGQKWRLPTKIELESILDETKAPLWIDTVSFPSTRTRAEFWTASPSARGNGSAYALDFADGTTSETEPGKPALVRCVHGRVTRNGRPEDRYRPDTTAVTESVMDTFTGLVWQREANPLDVTSEAAVSYCAALDGGTKGWRLPAYKELLTLVDPTRVNSAFDPSFFPPVPTNWWFRSLNPVRNGTDADLLVWFYFGTSFTQGAISEQIRFGNAEPRSYHARCVR